MTALNSLWPSGLGGAPSRVLGMIEEVEKRYGDSFAGTDLVDRLAERDVQRIVLCGAQSDMCIRSTFYGGIYRGYPVTLVSDAHTTEDLREFGMTFAPQDAIAMVNAHAAFTKLPDVEGSVTTTADALLD